jgi:hypothetical protein
MPQGGMDSSDGQVTPPGGVMVAQMVKLHPSGDVFMLFWAFLWPKGTKKR